MKTRSRIIHFAFLLCRFLFAAVLFISPSNDLTLAPFSSDAFTAFIQQYHRPSTPSLHRQQNNHHKHSLSVSYLYIEETNEDDTLSTMVYYPRSKSDKLDPIALFDYFTVLCKNSDLLIIQKIIYPFSSEIPPPALLS
jgi:hypothetical protein